jgi:serine/threonine-protein kinase
VPPSRRTEVPVPAALEAVVMACLEKDPERRPQTAAELSDLLGRAGGGTEWTNERARRWRETHRPESAEATAAAESAASAGRGRGEVT